MAVRKARSRKKRASKKEEPLPEGEMVPLKEAITEFEPPEPEEYDTLTDDDHLEQDFAQESHDKDRRLSRYVGHIQLPEDFDPTKPLRRARWEHFAQYIALQGLMPDAAYIAIGGRSKNPRESALKLQNKPMVRQRILALQEHRIRAQLEQTSYTRDDLIGTLWRNIHDARSLMAISGKGEIVRDELGQPVRKPDIKGINQAVELLGREIGMFPREQRIRNMDDGIEGLDLGGQLAYLKQVLLEASDGAIDLDTSALLQLLTPGAGDQAPQQDHEQPDRAVPALPEADGVPQPGEAQAGEVSPGGEPAGQNDVWDR